MRWIGVLVLCVCVILLIVKVCEVVYGSVRLFWVSLFLCGR